MLFYSILVISLSWISLFTNCQAVQGERNSKTTIRNPVGVTEAIHEEEQPGNRNHFGNGYHKRNIGLYPEWFKQKIKKLVGTRFMHSYFSPSEYHANSRDIIPTKNFRRSFYGLSNIPHGLNQIGLSDDFAENNIAPQSLQGAQMIDLPSNFQELPPQAFHELAMHEGGQLVELPNSDEDILIASHGHHRHHHQHNHCVRRPCLNGGTCIHHRHSTVSFRCSCRPGFRGLYCEIPAVSCVPNPCHNDGSCTLNNNGYFCTCPADFKGPNCLIQASCFSHPCQNGGTCIELESSYTCNCIAGFQGQSCDEKIDVCMSNPCKNDGVCKETTTTTFECICKEGFACADCSCNTTTILTQTTKQTNCPSGFCKNGGTCFPTEKSYNCQCLDGFHGVDCAIPDLCKKNPCENGGVCVQVGADYKCICTYGFKGVNCQMSLSCVSHPCINGGTCHETDLDFKCTCSLGYKGVTCEDLNPCAHNPCANNAHCIEKGPFYTCVCEEGFRGKDCKEKDPCLPNPCLNGYCSELSVGVPVCNCTEGWNGDLCEIRNDCFPNRCLNGGTCTHNGVSHHCICTEKFHGSSCEFINPCHESPCQNGGVCQTTDIGFICACASGYRGHHCEIGGHCHPNPCHHNGRCFEGDKEFICECDPGYSGHLCEVQDFCDPNPCHNNGQCIEEDGTYSCSCPFGFLGHTCEESICLPSPCKNGGTCIASNTEHGYACECVFPYHGHDCEEWDPCIPSPCKNGGTCKSHLKEISELHLHEGALQSLLHGADESVVDVVEPDEEGIGESNFTVTHHPDLYEEHDQATNSDVGHIPHAYLAKHLPRLHSESIHSLINPLHADIDDGPTQEEDDALHNSFSDNDLSHIDNEDYHIHHHHHHHRHRHEYDHNPDIGYEEANSIHESHLDDHPNEGEHPFTLHHDHHHDLELHHDDLHPADSSFKDHSGGLQTEVSSLIDHSHLNLEHEHPHGHLHDTKTTALDEAALEQITKNVVKAVLKHNQHPDASKKSKIAKRKKAAIRKRTIQNLYVCECPPGYLGAHCQHSNPCAKSPCRNGGVCIPRGNRYQCQCISGYAGLNCEDLHPCAPNPCQHSGVCRLAHNTRGYHCDCAKGYKGYQCEKVNHCANGNPCQHGGKCVSTDIGIECRCRQRFGGNLCEVDKCEGCSLDAHCKQGHCVCKPGFIGNGYKCKSIGDICSPNPCENKGKCQQGQDGKIFICQCESGYTGSRCEFFNPCQSSPCKHNGVCVDNTNSRQKGIILIEHTDYKCFCPQGYRGKNCEETSLGACSSIPCLNNATCFDSSDEYHRKNLKHPDDFECFCRHGYSGKQCEIPHFGCWSHPCQNGGSCLDPSVLPEVSFDSYGYKCNCLPDYVGRNCEVTLHGPSPCFSAPCLHNGRCVDASTNTDPDLHFDDLNSYKCFCNAVYSGKNCEVPFPACTSAPCYHNGTCIDGTTHPDFNFDENGYHCLCAVGYEGKSCERQYVFASPEEEEQVLHPTDSPDVELLTPTPMVVYVRPPKTTPRVGTVEKAKPGIVIVHQRTTPKPMLDLPIEDISLKQAHDASHHAAVAQTVTNAKDSTGNRDDINEVLNSLHHQTDHPPPLVADQGQSTIVRIVPDTGLPGGAALVVDEVPKHGAGDPLSARMVSLVPDKVATLKDNSVSGESRHNVPVNTNIPQAAPQQTNAFLQQQQPVQPQQAQPYINSQPAMTSMMTSYASPPYGYNGYSNMYNAQNGQIRSFGQRPYNWQDTYNKILKQRSDNVLIGKRNRIKRPGKP